MSFDHIPHTPRYARDTPPDRPVDESPSTEEAPQEEFSQHDDQPNDPVLPEARAIIDQYFEDTGGTADDKNTGPTTQASIPVTVFSREQAEAYERAEGRLPEDESSAPAESWPPEPEYGTDATLNDNSQEEPSDENANPDEQEGGTTPRKSTLWGLLRSDPTRGVSDLLVPSGVPRDDIQPVVELGKEELAELDILAGELANELMADAMSRGDLMSPTQARQQAYEILYKRLQGSDNTQTEQDADTDTQSDDKEHKGDKDDKADEIPDTPDEDEKPEDTKDEEVEEDTKEDKDDKKEETDETLDNVPDTPKEDTEPDSTPDTPEEDAEPDADKDKANDEPATEDPDKTDDIPLLKEIVVPNDKAKTDGAETSADTPEKTALDSAAAAHYLISKVLNNTEESSSEHARTPSAAPEVTVPNTETATRKPADFKIGEPTSPDSASNRYSPLPKSTPEVVMHRIETEEPQRMERVCQAISAVLQKGTTFVDNKLIEYTRIAGDLGGLEIALVKQEAGEPHNNRLVNQAAADAGKRNLGTATNSYFLAHGHESLFGPLGGRRQAARQLRMDPTYTGADKIVPALVEAEVPALIEARVAKLEEDRDQVIKRAERDGRPQEVIEDIRTFYKRVTHYVRVLTAVRNSSYY